MKIRCGPRVAVTGAAGFVGSAVVRALAASGIETVPIVRRIDARAPEASRAADVTARAAMASVLGGCDVLIHAAALVHRRGASEEALVRTNAHGTRVTLEAAAEAGVRRVLLVSSVSVYGGGCGMNEDAALNPRTPYGRSKVAAEHAAIEVAAERGLELVIARPSSIIGPGDPGSMAVLGRSLARGRFVWVGSGTNQKSPIAVDDVARACVTMALDRDAAGAVFNVAGPPVTVRELVECYSRALRVSVPAWSLPAGLVRAGFQIARPVSFVVPPLASGRAAIDAWLSTDVFDTTRYESRFGTLAIQPWRDSLTAEAEWIVGK